MKNLAIVQIDDELSPLPATNNSAGLLPSKLAGRKLNAAPLIEWLVRRISEAELIDGIVVVMPDAPQYRELASLVPLDIPCHFSNKKTPLARLADASKEYPSEAIVRVPLETPFCDPILIDRLLTTAQGQPGADYIGFCLEGGCPASQSSIGLFTEWIRPAALAKANRELKSKSDSYRIDSSFLNYPDLFQLEMLPVPQSLNRDDLRFSVVDDEDWEHLLAIVDALGAEMLQWQDVVRIIDTQPTIRHRMAQRNKLIA
ncbi:NTP transferase domain-containing protein [Bremerella cremea]|uniref:NTP transferase domain-containing protein n=1 Tax=Bremerella cremea TaxID=1031537 RepID=UPI0031E57D7E